MAMDSSRKRSSSLGSLGASTIASGAAASQAATSQAAARKLSSIGPKSSMVLPGTLASPASPAWSPASPASPASPGMQRRGALKSMSVPQLTDMKKPPSETVGPPKEGIFSRNWTSEHKRLLHEQSERHWLRLKNKHGYIDFSDEERNELRRYFDALADGEQTVGLERLENMLISLGLAPDKQEVRRIVDSIDTNGNGELDFEEYLEIFRARTDSEIFQVFKAMMEGRLGDRNLNFQTVISNYRRKLFLKTTGASNMRAVRLPSDGDRLDHSTKILHNFAALQRSRYSEAVALAESGEGPELGKHAMPFEPTEDIPAGNLAIVWRGVTHDHELVSSRPTSADRSKRTVPESPRTVIATIVKVSKPKKRNGPHNATIMIQAPAFEEASGRGSPVNWARS